MAFLLEPGDLIWARPVSSADVSWGDLLVGPAADGRLPVVHRLVWRRRSARGWSLRTRGDAVWALDPPVTGERVQKVGWVRTELGWISLESRVARALGVGIGLYSAAAAAGLDALESAVVAGAGAAARFGASPGRAARDVVDRWTIGVRPALVAWVGAPARAARRAIERRAAPRTEAVRTILEGRISGERVLDGEIVVRGDAVIERGAAVTIGPGSRLSFDPRGSASRSVLRPSPRGWRPVTDRLSANCIVFGRLRLQGTAERPVTVEAGEGGGLVLAGRADARLEHVRFQGAGGRPGARRVFVCVDESRALLADCSFRGLATALWSAGRARLRVDRCEIRGCAEGLAVHGGRALLSDVRIAGCADAVTVGAGGRAWLRRTTLDAGAAAASVQRGALRMEDCVLRAEGGPALWIDGPRARARSARCAFERSPQGAGVRGGGSWTSADDSFRDCEEGVHLTGDSRSSGGRPARVSIRGAALERCGSAILVEGERSAALAGVRIRSARWLGLGVREGARASGSVDVSGAPVGVEVSDRAQAAFEELRVADCAKGVWARGRSRLRIRGGELAGCALLAEDEARVGLAGMRVVDPRGPGVGLFGAARIALLDAALGGSGLEAAGGRSRLRRVRLAGDSSAAALRGGEHRWSDVECSGPSSGVRLGGDAALAASGLRVSAGDHGLWLQDAARLRLEGGAIRGGGTGLLVEGSAAAALGGTRIEGAAREGAWVRDTAGLSGSLQASGCAGAGVRVSGRGRVELDGGRLGGNGAGLEALGGESLLRGVALDGNRTAAGSLKGGVHRWERVSCSGSGIGVGVYGDAALSALSLDASACDHGLWLQDSARARLERGAIRGCGTGLLAEGMSSVELDGTRIVDAAREAAWLRGGAGLRGSLEASACAGTALRLSDDAALELDGGALDDNGTGLEALGGRSLLRGVRLAGNRVAGAGLKGGTHRWERVVCAGSKIGVGVYGDAALSALSLDASACDHGLWLQDSARARLERGAIRGCGTGLLAEGMSSVELDGTRIVDAAREAAWLRGGAGLRGSLEASACAGTALRLSDDAALELDGGALDDNGAGLEALGGRSLLRGVRLAGNRVAGASLKGGTHRWERVVCAGSKIGVGVYGGAAFSAEGFEASACDHGVWLQGAARADLRESSLDACGTGLLAEGSSAAELDRVRIVDAAREGAWVRAGGRLKGSLEAVNCAAAGLRADGDARIEMDGARFERNGTGLEASGGGGRLRDVRFLDNRLAGLRILGGQHRGERLECSGSEVGLYVGGDASAELVAVQASDCRRGVRAEGRARVRVAGGLADRCEVGLLVEGDARASAEDLRVRGAASHGVWVRERGRLEGALDVEGSAGAGVFLSDRADARLAGGAFRRNDVGLQCDRGDLSLEGGVVEENRRAGLVFSAGRHRLDRVRVSASPEAVCLHGTAAARIVGAEIAGGIGLLCTARSRCRLVSTRIGGGETGVWLQEDARALIFGGEIAGHARYGLRLSQRARAFVAGTGFARNAVIALLLEDRSSARARANRLGANPTGFKVDGESRLRLAGNAIEGATTDALWRSATARVTEAACLPAQP